MASSKYESILQEEWILLDNNEQDEQVAEVACKLSPDTVIYSPKNDFSDTQSGAIDLNLQRTTGTELDDNSDLGFCDEIPPKLEMTSSIKCYKHCRNNQLNVFLDISLALVVATAVGLGTGHFLGWSHRCLKQGQKFSALSSFSSVDLLYTQYYKQSSIVEKALQVPEKIESFPHEHGTDNLRNEHGADNLRNEHGFMQICFCENYNCNALSKGSAEINVSTDDFLVPEAKQCSNTLIIKLHENVMGKELFPSRSNTEINKKVLHEKQEPQHCVNYNFSPGKHTENKNNHITNQEKIMNANSMTKKLFKNFHIAVDQGKYIENNLQSLKKDFDKVILTLRELAVNKITSNNLIKADDLRNDLEHVGYIYKKFEMHINQEIEDLENFMQMPSHGKMQKQKLKVVKKRIHSMIYSVDGLCKASIKSFKDNKQRLFRMEKLSLNIIENLDKKWEKNRKIFEKKRREVFEGDKIEI